MVVVVVVVVVVIVVVVVVVVIAVVVIADHAVHLLPHSEKEAIDQVLAGEFAFIGEFLPW